MARVIAEKDDVIPLLAEVFRTYGFEGASLARISEGTRLGKGSIYHFFPGGKEEMAQAVLGHVDAWFRQHVFEPLNERDDAVAGIKAMFDDVSRYFLSGQRVCLVGVFALGNERDRFAVMVRDYFIAWIDALASALVRTGRKPKEARTLAEEVVGGIQGALVLARALDSTDVFADALKRFQKRLLG
ncbi:TetR/AcrR family transcriptional regulator [Herbaspirillum sp. WGmk3]|uniref:TetR/AcrR family transcriptional regulator n=1 Tax=Herbaspirillum huttiense subsp. lycopersici TaxID=3074428 RepID=A0ABU2ER49_9BURK|nr:MULTISPECIES: TetR/AcrR family transcriptional regulator [Herbaspirillum]MCO4855440.1 TetR/AcrR family transcriptional regulator [Herbaspirillum sp. WGmk3]MDR6739861.1 AcrR family transcriptional regulator [Herbaspirillum sp. 1173]MDR9850637.1 TetR/AcrR family transcriptional regulator [Herbaspirillum huttiense SE1]QBP76696.1 TetR/AcrR family transcriptional regulator [Herbaspirillum huttiense]